MKLTAKQRQELAVIQYFVPSWVDFRPTTDADIAAFFAWSDRGIKYDLGLDTTSGLAALHFGKQYRDLHVTQWREGIETGILSKYEVLHDLPAIDKALNGALLGSPMYESKDGEMVFAGYERPEDVDFRLNFGRSVLLKS